MCILYIDCKKKKKREHHPGYDDSVIVISSEIVTNTHQSPALSVLASRLQRTSLVSRIATNAMQCIFFALQKCT